jgi:hypothetical protein
MTLKENRVVMMMSGDELRVVDDYRFANRIPTRAKAMRGLIERGLNDATADMLNAGLAVIDAFDPVDMNPEQFNAWSELGLAISKAEGR